MASYESILTFWFGTSPDDADVVMQQSVLWWMKEATTDRLIHERFRELVEQAANGELKEWENEPRGMLVLIILIDQFCRNIFRGSPRAFAHDHLARRWCLDGIARGVDRELRPIERVFFYLPLEHSESLVDQNRSVELYARLLDEVPQNQKQPFSVFLQFAQKHREIIEQFGRFPHRNAILGRESTLAEVEFLKQPGSSF
jgi:uncharacterized protein (DUF924 family)